MTATHSAPYFLQQGDFVMIARRREFLAAGRQRARERCGYVARVTDGKFGPENKDGIMLCCFVLGSLQG